MTKLLSVSLNYSYFNISILFVGNCILIYLILYEWELNLTFIVAFAAQFEN